MEAIAHPLILRIPNFWPVSWLPPRPLSLSIRLFGNMFGEHTVTAILLFLYWLVIPYVIYLTVVLPLGLFVAVVQTFVFCMLAAMEGGHEEEHGHGHGGEGHHGS